MRLIDADALIEQLKSSSAYNDYEWSMYADGFIEDIENAPTIDRPQGEWIMSKPEEDGFGAVFQCSRCSCEVDCVPTNFCPNCGARMKGEDNGKSVL